MTLISFNSALFFNFVIRTNGSTLSKLRSKMIRLGLDLALISTSCSSFTNSTVMPARLEASLILTEKKRSLKTARTFLLPCFCIQFSYINSFSEELPSWPWFLDPIETGRKITSYSVQRGDARSLRIGLRSNAPGRPHQLQKARPRSQSPPARDARKQCSRLRKLTSPKAR